MTYDITGRHFIAPPADLDRSYDPAECEEDPAERRRRKLLPNVIGLGVKKRTQPQLKSHATYHRFLVIPDLFKVTGIRLVFVFGNFLMNKTENEYKC